MEKETTFKPGRLSITCIDAKNIRSRADATNARGGTGASANNLSPYLLFRLNGTERTSRTGNSLGHDVLFSNEVVAFDLPSPEDSELIIEVCDDESNESVGQATYLISKVLMSGDEALETLAVIKSGDTSTNSVVRLKFAFVQAKTGVIKLGLGGVENVDDTTGAYATISTPEGQSKKVSLSDADNASGFWMGPANWFGDFAIRLQQGDACLGSGKLSLLSCYGSEIRNSVSQIPLIPSDDGQVPVPVVTVNHWFLEAGVVRVRSIRASNLRDASLGARGLANPRVIVKSHGKAHSTTMVTDAPASAESNSYHWNSELQLPVVDEYTLTIECAEVDDVSGEHESIGSAELSLLPLFKTGHVEASINLKHTTELGETLDGGKVHLVLTFEAPQGVAFPSDQPTVTSYILGQHDTIVQTKKNMATDADDGTFTEEAIQKAFAIFDLDKNGYIGVAELRHILIMMGEHVSDEEIDLMISMLDLNGDGQVSFTEFKAMVESPDPAKEDFLQGGIVAQAGNSSDFQKRHAEIEKKKREVFSRCADTCQMDKEDIYRMLKTVKEKSRESFDVGYLDICALLPAAFCSRADCRAIFDLLCSGDHETADSRDMIMTFTNFVTGFSLEEKCKIAFEMFDVDNSGYLSIDEVVSMMTSTNLSSRELIKKRAENFMMCADTDGSKGITIDELIVAAEKLPNMLYPPQTKQPSRSLVNH